MSSQNLDPNQQIMLKVLETVQQMQVQMNTIQGQMTSMQAEINQNSRDIVFVKSLSISLENKLGEVVTRLSNVEAKVDAVEAKVDTVIARVDAVEAKVDTVITRVDAVEAKVDTNIKEVKALREDFRDQEHYINVLDLKVAKLRNDYYDPANKVNQPQQ